MFGRSSRRCARWSLSCACRSNDRLRGASPLRVIGAPIFYYGTLLDRRVLARRSGDAALLLRSVPAVLLGFRRVGLRGTPYPTLRRDGHAALAGELIRPSAAAFSRLTAYEGGAYRLCPVHVLTPRGRRRARAWLAAPCAPARAPGRHDRGCRIGLASGR